MSSCTMACNCFGGKASSIETVLSRLYMPMFLVVFDSNLLLNLKLRVLAHFVPQEIVT